MTRLIFIIKQLKQKTIFQLFTIYTRYLLGCAFVIAAIGMGKIYGAHFPASGENNNFPGNAITQVFAVFSNSSVYWEFIGCSQIIAGALLMTQKFARLGSVVFLPIIANIFIITVAYGFSGTPIITGLMLLANIYLLVWEAPTLQYLVINPTPTTLPMHDYVKPKNSNLWIVTGLLLLITIVIGMRLIKIHTSIIMLICLGEGIIAFIFNLFMQSDKKSISFN